MSAQDDIELRRAAFEKNKTKIGDMPKRRFFYLSHISVITILSVFSVTLSVFTASETLLYQRDRLDLLMGLLGAMRYDGSSKKLIVEIPNVVVVNTGTRTAAVMEVALFYKQGYRGEYAKPDREELGRPARGEECLAENKDYGVRQLSLQIEPAVVKAGEMVTIPLRTPSDIKRDEDGNIVIDAGAGLADGHYAATCVEISIATPDSTDFLEIPGMSLHVGAENNYAAVSAYNDIVMKGRFATNIIDRRRSTLRWLNPVIERLEHLYYWRLLPLFKRSQTLDDRLR